MHSLISPALSDYTEPINTCTYIYTLTVRCWSTPTSTRLTNPFFNTFHNISIVAWIRSYSANIIIIDRHSSIRNPQTLPRALNAYACNMCVWIHPCNLWSNSIIILSNIYGYKLTCTIWYSSSVSRTTVVVSVEFIVETDSVSYVTHSYWPIHTDNLYSMNIILFIGQSSICMDMIEFITFWYTIPPDVQSGGFCTEQEVSILPCNKYSPLS